MRAAVFAIAVVLSLCALAPLRAEPHSALRRSPGGGSRPIPIPKKASSHDIPKYTIPNHTPPIGTSGGSSSKPKAIGQGNSPPRILGFKIPAKTIPASKGEKPPSKGRK
ncbi:hypothetical protein ONE63_007330 [Megalurothrips usitatus]|uniref:Uncharacterized protein n=1 Tax=Megalurothrips usitatus TaxID=439358 RepID=A0AAV7XRQ6_9NEOP|nr:hypothetical protein ONE63_007330 [Megalurothrips usitatus]